MREDNYLDFAERYDWMKQDNPARRDFFQSIFEKNNVNRVHDCACGTGQDLLLFHGMGMQVSGSDLSDAMLKIARNNVADNNISLKKLDFCKLPQHYQQEFDAVVCLSNSINELLEDHETLLALRSMKAVLQKGGILVFDQGQTDASLQNPPAFTPILNNRDFSRLFTMEYAGEIQTVNIFDFVHTEDSTDFKHAVVRIRIRLQDSWNQILREAGFSEIEFYGDWHAAPYNKDTSQRLICVAKK